MPFPPKPTLHLSNPCSAQFSGPGGPATSGVWLGWCFQGCAFRGMFGGKIGYPIWKCAEKSCQKTEIAWNHEGDRIKVFQNWGNCSGDFNLTTTGTQLICQVSSTYHYFSFRKYSHSIPGIYKFSMFFSTWWGRFAPTFHVLASHSIPGRLGLM